MTHFKTFDRPIPGLFAPSRVFTRKIKPFRSKSDLIQLAQTSAWSQGLSVARYTGTETLTGVPTLVRLSEAIPGFRYADFASPADGADLAFFDADENELPYEIDEWNTNGESLVWVRLPVLTNGVPFLCAYGNPQPVTRNPQLSSHDVWRDYAGVWHMNEDAGTAFDSTEHGLDALPDHGTNELADVSQMVAYENGACGRARVNSKGERLEGGNFMTVPSYDALSLGGDFTISVWANLDSARNDPIIMRDYNDKVGSYGYHVAEGWSIEDKNLGISVTIEGGTNHANVVSMPTPCMISNWVNVVVVYTSGIYVEGYADGVFRTNGVVAAVTENGLPLTFGGGAFGSTSSIVGQYDEIRLRGGTLSADRIKADYEMIADRNWLAYGIVRKPGAADEEILGGVQLWENGPYWAECNVGADKPEDYGYYFWWGDTVGFKRVGDGWNAVDGSRTGFSFESANCPTYGMGNPELWAAGYADLSGNLVSAYDAATAYLGAPWRMPTDAEWSALISHCDTEWTTKNGVYGRLVKGRGAYASKSIFLPAVGYGSGSSLHLPSSYGDYWSSTPGSDGSDGACCLFFLSDNISRSSNYYRYHGRPVRPVRGFAR